MRTDLYMKHTLNWAAYDLTVAFNQGRWNLKRAGGGETFVEGHRQNLKHVKVLIREFR